MSQCPNCKYPYHLHFDPAYGLPVPCEQVRAVAKKQNLPKSSVGFAQHNTPYTPEAEKKGKQTFNFDG